VLITCWSTKGGSGTTVVACSLALLLGATSPDGSLLIDLGGDAPATFGIAEPTGPGLDQWLALPNATLADLNQLETYVTKSLRVVPTGAPSLVSGHALAAVLANESRPVVVDAGRLDTGPSYELAASATVSLLVLRPCYLALRRAAAASIRPSAVILIGEPQRALTRKDVESVLGVPVRAEIAFDPSIARAVDAGLLASRLPTSLSRSLAGAAAPATAA
jgi:uncharacterized lipoprotein YbaY